MSYEDDAKLIGSFGQKGFIYLASPYTHPNMSVRVMRFIAARQACIDLFKEGKAVYSPIVHWHQIVTTESDLPHDFASFKVQNDCFIEACSTFVVLGIDGWSESKGVDYELRLAQKLGKDTELWHMETIRAEYVRKAIEKL